MDFLGVELLWHFAGLVLGLIDRLLVRVGLAAASLLLGEGASAAGDQVHWISGLLVRGLEHLLQEFLMHLGVVDDVVDLRRDQDVACLLGSLLGVGLRVQSTSERTTVEGLGAVLVSLREERLVHAGQQGGSACRSGGGRLLLSVLVDVAKEEPGCATPEMAQALSFLREHPLRVAVAEVRHCSTMRLLDQQVGGADQRLLVAGRHSSRAQQCIRSLPYLKRSNPLRLRLLEGYVAVRSVDATAMVVLLGCDRLGWRCALA